MTRIVYQDIDEFSAALRGTEGCFIRTAPSTVHWSIEGIELATSSMQQLQTGGPFTFAGSGKLGMLTFHMPVASASIIRVNGHVLSANSFVILREDRPFVWSGSGACQWVTLAVPLDHWLARSPTLLTGADDGVSRRTAQEHLDAVRASIDRALAERASDATDTWRQTVEREFAEVLAHAVDHSVPADPSHRIGRPQFSRAKVIASVLALMNAKSGQPLFIPDLCRASQVSERALRNIFNEYFGVGPMRLLKMRQLHEIRAALLRAHAREDTVTHIAARFGAFDGSLLARNYKALFGESPSSTLFRSPTESPERMRVDWLRHASRIFRDRDPSSV